MQLLIRSLQIKTAFDNSKIKATVTLTPLDIDSDPTPFSAPKYGESDVKQAKRQLLELPLPSAILSKGLPPGWEVSCTDATDVHQDGVYFWHTQTLQPTAVLWRDPGHALGKLKSMNHDDLVENVRPIKYHFPEHFQVG